MPRLEDARLLRGEGRYTDDIALPGQVWAVFVRSPHAHALIRQIDTSTARASPGVLAVLTGVDYVAAGFGGMAQGAVPADAVDWQHGAFEARQGHIVVDIPHLPFAIDRARYPGELLAIVVAETLEQARDAADAVIVDYKPLPAVTNAAAALQRQAPQLWEAAPGNLVLNADVCGSADLESAFTTAHVVISQRFHSQRTVTAQLEPRAAIGTYDPASQRFTLHTGCQGAHRMRMAVCAALRLPPDRVRVVVPDTGGGFGSRTNCYGEQVAVLWAAREIGRPVKWRGDRSECFLSDFQGRDNTTMARLAFDADGRIRAYDVEITGNIGAYTVAFASLHNGWRVGTSVYDIPLAGVRLRGALTNTVPTAPYRGAGRPEAMLVIESLLDMAARRLGIDRMELRRRNLIARERQPYRTASGLTYDSGAFAENMTQLLDLADWRGFERRRSEARNRNRLAGFGFANFVETPVGAPHERVDLRVLPEGRVELAVGTQSTGQGHATSFAQVVADLLGVAPTQVILVTGDTDLVASGGGSHSDRSMRVAGTLMAQASAAIVTQATEAAAMLLGNTPDRVSFAGGYFQTPASNLRLDLFDIARALVAGRLPDELPRELAASQSFSGRIPAYPTGAAACEVEIDPETGMLEITRYATIDDAGQPVNPLILHGQAYGGIVQGAGPALIEGVAYNDQGQLLTGSFMDYGMPRAAMFPRFEVQLVEDPTTGNPLRIKGGSEGGTTPAAAVVMTAVFDALAPLGIKHLDMPATPERIWRAIADAAAGQAVAPAKAPC